jgi:hypothetical protein
MIAKTQITRLAYLVRKHIHAALLDEAGGMRIEVAAEEIADGAVIFIRASVLGYQRSRTIFLDTPDGPWQAFKACLGLRHRTKTVRVNATVLFPELSGITAPNLYLEIEKGEI